MLNTKEHFNQLDATLAVNEIDNETAAGIQGGVNLTLYNKDNFTGVLGEFNFGKVPRLSVRADNKIESIKITAGKWQFFTREDFKGSSRIYTKNSGNKGRINLPSSFDNVISSFKRID